MKSEYKTRQREELLRYLASVPGHGLTVSEICTHLKEEGYSIGTTTVYRTLDKLVEDGEVNRYVAQDNTGAVYEYIDRSSNCSQPVCFHCKCERCGRLIHLKCDEMVHVADHLKEHHGFVLDPVRTVFYGICGECRTALAER